MEGGAVSRGAPVHPSTHSSGSQRDRKSHVNTLHDPPCESSGCLMHTLPYGGKTGGSGSPREKI